VLRAALAETVPGTPLPGTVSTHAPWLHLEFDIPRLGRRVDAVLVTSTAVIPIEFKVGATKFEQLDYEQAWDYGLDLKNFHAPSHAAAIFPILCATDAAKSDRRWKPPHADGVRPPFCCNAAGLGPAIALALSEEKVPVAIPPRPRDCLLFREPVVLGNPGNKERRNRGFEIDAWHRLVGERSAGSYGNECTCVPYRVKPHAIDIRVNIDRVHWFLSPPRDTRSSLYRPLYHSFRGAQKMK
jgi:hypothetical protein